MDDEKARKIDALLAEAEAAAKKHTAMVAELQLQAVELETLKAADRIL